ncbi:xylulose kinase [Salibacterium salarium]|uniref:Xylulose kinase n=1 Tax=Salibacterium salarium TaxID=284579 RepID=A0A3R9QQY1_9BACI|nr:FGGY family carbohydrate kinase [Salibacterium salarium]RSL31448.1 xylulose kinase [Salibacterium salarium]
MSHVIGIDIGTSGIKIGTINREGIFQLSNYESYPLHYNEEKVEVEIESLWGIVRRLLVKTATDIQNSGGRLEGISLSTFCHASVFLDEHGEPLLNGIMYMDKRGRKEAEELQEKRTSSANETIKNRIDPSMSSGVNVMWFKNNDPDAFEKVAYWGHLSSYILYRLTGRFVMDWTQASFTGLYNITDYCWSKEMLDMADIDEELMPPVVNPLEVIGKVVKVDPVIDGIPVITGAADTACASLAIGLQPNEMFESVGTSNVLTVCTDDSSQLDDRLLNRCHVLENQWLSHGPMSTPGASIEWFYQEFLKDTNHDNKKEVLNHYAKASSLGANGVFFLPYMFGERAPIWDGLARGVFFGLHLNTSKADMLQSIYEGCAFGLRQIYDIIQERYKVNNISSFCAIGGGAKNVYWGQIKADVLNADINIKEISEAAVLGSCLIASKSVGFISSFEDGKINNACYHYLTPSCENKNEYEELYSFFCDIYPSVKHLFKKNPSIYS